MSDPFRSDPFRPEAPLVIALVGGRVAQIGDTVRLHPTARADAFDLLLDNHLARIEAIQEDYEGRVYLVVTLDDDPGRTQEDERVLPGHRFYFFPDEVELTDAPAYEDRSQAGGAYE